MDEGALRRNLRRVLHAAGGSAALPMLKANAYGLGMGPVLEMVRRELSESELWAAGVAAVAEGEELRRLGWRGRAVVFAPVPPGEYARAARADLTLALSETAAVRRWAEAARAVGRRLAFHTEIDTGMGRAGFPAAGAADWGREVMEAAADLLAWEGCFTHFHSADEPDLAPTDEQHARLLDALERLPAASGPRVIHSANSAASVRRGGYGGDVVRPGIFLYGGSAGPGASPEAVASLRARIALVRRVPPGSTCGYGATYTATREERWGTVAIGYGDGLPRALGTAGGEAIVRGRKVPIRGRVSMDVTVVDLTELPEVEAGEVATFIGRDGEAAITVDEVAARAGTISYEVLTGLGTRLPRVYLPPEGTETPSAA